jgi:hypothetical protein
MRRRLAGLLVLAAALTAFVLPASAAIAAPQQATTLLLATEAVGEGEPLPGPEPAGADDEDNAAAPDDYEANFLWGAAVGLLGLMLLGAVALGGLYYLLVARPKQQAA